MNRREFGSRLFRLTGAGVAAGTFFSAPYVFGDDSDESAAISQSEMESIYEEVKTPYKYGIILDKLNGQLVDCPSIFRKDGVWYMVFISMTGGVGYETFLAKSDDLIKWEYLGPILTFPQTGWDAWQVAGYASLIDTTWGGSAAIQQYDGKYWLTYLGGSRKGYETDPLSMGVAYTNDPTAAKQWTRYEQNPIFSPQDEDARWFEKTTLYKSTVIWDKAQTLGAPFVMYYNAKHSGAERIGMAISKDMRNWTRYGADPVIDNHRGISGDPQIVKIGDYWVMFYFGAFWKPKAFDTFAVSKDLIHWTKWTGTDLIAPSEPWDATYAHKPWCVKVDGVVYHFYCAVGNQGRAIALATSKKL